MADIVPLLTARTGVGLIVYFVLHLEILNHNLGENYNGETFAQIIFWEFMSRKPNIL